MTPTERSALFISHATPEDNAFTVWLGSRLSAAGYEVWADVLRLRGGQDWERMLLDALRCRAFKVLLVCTPLGLAKDGVREEIHTAHQTARKIGDREFIIPLRLEPYEPPFDIALAQYVDFRPGWGAGLRELLETLEETYRAPRQRGPNQTSLDRWRDAHRRRAENVAPVPEDLISTWLRVSAMPAKIRYYDFRGAIDHGRAGAALRSLRFAHCRHMRGFFGFAALSDYQDDLGPALPIETVAVADLGTFLDEGHGRPRLDPTQARDIVSHLVRETWDRALAERGLPDHAFADGSVARWVPEGLVASETIGFEWDGLLKGRRSLVGKHKSVRWHFGCTVRPWFAAEPQIRLTPRVLFSEDGRTVLGSARRLHRLRRTVAKGWWNDRWRDVTLAFLWWLAGGQAP